nr:MAG TPA: hypothetical protein [Caudoviricetes sp.]
MTEITVMGISGLAPPHRGGASLILYVADQLTKGM